MCNEEYTYDDGYSAGWDDGQSDGYETGYEDGVATMDDFLQAVKDIFELDEDKVAKHIILINGEARLPWKLLSKLSDALEREK